MTDEIKMVEVKINRTNVFVAGKELAIGIHSVKEALADRWLKSGVAILPKDDKTEQSAASMAKEIAKLTAENDKLKAKKK